MARQRWAVGAAIAAAIATKIVERLSSLLLTVSFS